MIRSKFKQLLVGLKAGRVTLKYPFEPHPTPPGYRGKVTINAERCTGCGGCATVCPARLIKVTDISPEWRIIRRHLERCIQCGRCAEACSERAVEMSLEFENATPDKHDLLIEQKIYMGTCKRCGRCYEPFSVLDRHMTIGFRKDEEINGI